MTDALKEAAERLARELFTNGFGDKADRLELVLPNNRRVGGWCEEVVVDRIMNVLISARNEALEEACAVVQGQSYWTDCINRIRALKVQS